MAFLEHRPSAMNRLEVEEILRNPEVQAAAAKFDDLIASRQAVRDGRSPREHAATPSHINEAMYSDSRTSTPHSSSTLTQSPSSRAMVSVAQKPTITRNSKRGSPQPSAFDSDETLARSILSGLPRDEAPREKIIPHARAQNIQRKPRHHNLPRAPATREAEMARINETVNGSKRDAGDDLFGAYTEAETDVFVLEAPQLEDIGSIPDLPPIEDIGSLPEGELRTHARAHAAAQRSARSLAAHESARSAHPLRTQLT